MMPKSQLEVLNLFRKNPMLKTSILQVNNALKKKSYARVYDSVKAMETAEILRITTVGKSSIAELNLNRSSIPYLSLLDEQEAIESKMPHLEKLLAIKEISQYLLIVTGSYAKGAQKKTSDLDLVILVPDNEKAIDVQKMAENLTYLFHPPVHLYVLNYKDFIEMLLDKKENYGKEIFRNHIIFKNAGIYYELLKEAIENGFKG